jgi:RNA recognition motif-containing protein
LKVSSRKIYVGGLPYATTDEELEAISTHGKVESVRIIIDQYTGKPRGFGFVEMSTADEVARAIEAPNGSQIDGRGLRVSEAKPRVAW